MNAYTQNPDTPAQCPRCGLRVLLSDLRRQVVAGRPTALRVCGDCLDEDSPQLRLGRLRFSDPQTVRNPSPERETDSTPSGAILGISFVLGVSALAPSE
jgi:hypothetical protein